MQENGRGDGSVEKGLAYTRLMTSFRILGIRVSAESVW